MAPSPAILLVNKVQSVAIFCFLPSQYDLPTHCSTAEELNAFAQKEGYIGWQPTSAKTGEGVQEAVMRLIRSVQDCLMLITLQTYFGTRRTPRGTGRSRSFNSGHSSYISCSEKKHVLLAHGHTLYFKLPHVVKKNKKINEERSNT